MGKHIIKDLLFSAAALCACVPVGAQVADNTANPTKTFSERIASGDIRGWTDSSSSVILV